MQNNNLNKNWESAVEVTTKLNLKTRAKKFLNKVIKALQKYWYLLLRLPKN